MANEASPLPPSDGGLPTEIGELGIMEEWDPAALDPWARPKLGKEYAVLVGGVGSSNQLFQVC